MSEAAQFWARSPRPMSHAATGMVKKECSKRYPDKRPSSEQSKAAQDLVDAIKSYMK